MALDFQPVCSLIQVDFDFSSGWKSLRFCFAVIGLIRGEEAMVEGSPCVVQPNARTAKLSNAARFFTDGVLGFPN